MHQLPTFEGWTVDVRLREFRRAEHGRTLEFRPFASPEGNELLRRWKESLASEPLDGDSDESVGGTFANPEDGTTYYLAPDLEGQDEVLWACPTNVDGSADFASAIPETDFTEPLSRRKRDEILRKLGRALDG